MNNQIVEGFPVVTATSAKEWRSWLAANFDTMKSVWLIIYHKQSQTQSVYYEEAVDQALCFGWIDSKPKKRDDSSYYQFFSKRNAKSNWSKVNKDKVERLINEGKMTSSGYEMVQIAKENGCWDALNEVDQLIVPQELSEAFGTYPKSRENWDAFPKSVRRGILEWIFNAKKQATRTRRIEETASKAAENIRANQWR